MVELSMFWTVLFTDGPAMRSVDKPYLRQQKSQRQAGKECPGPHACLPATMQTPPTNTCLAATHPFYSWKENSGREDVPLLAFSWLETLEEELAVLEVAGGKPSLLFSSQNRKLAHFTLGECAVCTLEWCIFRLIMTGGRIWGGFQLLQPVFIGYGLQTPHHSSHPPLDSLKFLLL